MLTVQPDQAGTLAFKVLARMKGSPTEEDITARSLMWFTIASRRAPGHRSYPAFVLPFQGFTSRITSRNGPKRSSEATRRRFLLRRPVPR